MLPPTAIKFAENFINWNHSNIIGDLVKVLLIGDIKELQAVCDHFNQFTTKEVYRESNDKAHALIVVPFDIFKGTTSNPEKFLYRHKVITQLKPVLGNGCRHLKMELSREQLIWTAFGFRRDDPSNWADGESLSTAFYPNNIRTSYTVKGVSPEEVPYWGQEHHENDTTHGVLVTLVVYKDKIIFSIPAGKRDLGETAWEYAVRETAEEAGLDIVSAAYHSAAYQGVTQPAIKAIFQPTPDARYPEVDNAVIVRSHSLCLHQLEVLLFQKTT